MTATNALTSAVASMAWRPKPKSSRRSQRTPGPAVRATGTKKARSELWSLVGIGGLGNGRNLPLCCHAAPRSARCSNDAAPLSRSVGSQDRVVARVRRGGYVRPRLAVFRPRYHSCHCRGRRCGRCRGNHQIVPLFRARTALGSAVAALIDNGASQPQKIRPGQAEPGRSGAVRTSADARAAALAPTGRTPTVLRKSGRRLVGARYAVAAARHPAYRAPLTGLSRLRELMGSLREGERRQQHSRDDQSFQHGECPQLGHTFVTTLARLRAISTAVLTASSRLSV